MAVPKKPGRVQGVVMRLPYHLQRFSYSFNEYGLARTALRAVFNVTRRVSPAERRFDRNYGVSTEGRVWGPQLGFDPELSGYLPTPVHAFTRLIRSLPIKYAEWNFVDIGCGRGRALVLAATFPFRSVTGVELSELLATRARENVEAFRKDLRCRASSMEVLQADALTYTPLPKTVVYMNSPFYGRLMEGFAEHLAACPVEMYVVYWNHRCRRLFLRREFEELGRGTEYSIFRTTAPCPATVPLDDRTVLKIPPRPAGVTHA
jgi:SAM-dependent methyltransferase